MNEYVGDLPRHNNAIAYGAQVQRRTGANPRNQIAGTRCVPVGSSISGGVRRSPGVRPFSQVALRCINGCSIQWNEAVATPADSSRAQPEIHAGGGSPFGKPHTPSAVKTGRG